VADIRHVEVDSLDAEGIWPLGGMHLPRVPFDYALLDAPLVTPLPTLGLDYLESRFARWFAEIFERARQAGERELVRIEM
jgi:hypothetical protein